MTATLLTQYAVYHCPECLQPIEFEFVDPPAEAVGGGFGSQLNLRGFGIGSCRTLGCERRRVRLKVPLRTIEVEELPPQEENPHGAQSRFPPRLPGG